MLMCYNLNHRYRSLVDRILGMRLVYQHPKTARQISFEFMNQQLVWQGFSEFIMFILPLLNLDKIRRSMKVLLDGCGTLKRAVL